ncbi:MAG: glycoside hydrolase [Acidobacteriia bacterium]|nr:glycoside hydrolase [Terriglobia bacterium]
MKLTKQIASVAVLCTLLSSISFSVSGNDRRSNGQLQGLATADPDILELQKRFQNPPDDCRVMMRWWWFGPAVARTELEREMRLMKEGGIGGFEVQPVYPVALDDAASGIKNLPFLSDEFIDALRFTSEKARELGLRMDLTLGSGWPYGGAQVPISDAAGKLRVVRARVPENSRRMPVPAVGAGEKLMAVFVCRSQGQSVVGDSIREITDIRDGAVRLPAGLQGPNEVLFFISSRSGMMVKRPAVGADGFVLNHYDRAAVEGYLRNVGDRLMQAFRAQPPHAVFCDSLEVYESDWTGDFLEEFHKRRGYDLKPHLPALVMDLGSESAAIRQDWGRTLTELFNERFMVSVHDWARRNHTLFRVQCYGIPPAVISSNALADLSEGEGSQWKSLRASRWAASASHLYGRAVTSSETWTWLHSPVFRATPLDMKAEANLHFLQGINQLVGHGWPYTAEGVEYPGWRFYAAGVFNENNPWWIVMPDVTRYLQRISYLLRQGQPSNDVAFYLPDCDAWAVFTPGRANMIDALRERVGPDAIPAVLDAGFNLDFFDDEALKQMGRIEKSVLALGANRYRVVILPNVERIPLETLKTLDEYVRSGGILIASRRKPALAPGFRETQAENAQIREISQRLFETPSARSRFVEDEKHQLGSTLRALLRPDIDLSPALPEIGFVHRKTKDVEIYFLANSSNSRQSVKAAFPVAGMKAEWWDPLSGSLSTAETTAEPEGRMTVSMSLEPYGSRILVFSKRVLPQQPKTIPLIPPLDLSDGWRVSFGPGKQSTTMEHLQSWIEDEATRYFSGTAVYEREIAVPDSMIQTGLKVRLDFGEGQPVPEIPGRSSGMQAWFDGPVREAAVVYVNDRRAGSIWCPPYAVDVSGLLTRGKNQIRILVANTAINYMAGRSLPDYRLLNLRYGVRFEPQDMDKIQPVPSGLLGPIRLIPGPRDPS